MLVLTSLLITLCGLFWINYKTSENVAPTVRLGLSLLCVGFGTIPIFFWLVFIPNFFFIALGAVVFLLVPTGVVAQMPVAAEVGSGDERDELGSG